MIETLETKAETKTVAEQLRYCADWFEAHEFDGSGCGVWAMSDGKPTVYLRGFDEMKRLFPGVAATRKREQSRYCYTLIADGIRFNATDWIDAPSSGAPEEVTL